MIAEQSLVTILDELDQVAPSAPLLALGQTVFWDEPMKLGLARQLKRREMDRKIVFGVHDTDYFAKLPHGKSIKDGFQLVPHNDTTTRNLWSASAEFSALFGSETVVSKDQFASAGLKTDLLNRARPGLMDQLTEAWGWKGIVSLDERTPVAAEVSNGHFVPELLAALDWAIGESISRLTGEGKKVATERADALKALVQAAFESQPNGKLPDLYEEIWPRLAEYLLGQEFELESSRTSELLKFNTETADLPRFQIVNAFLRDSSRPIAEQAYNEAIEGGGAFTLDRFGTGAIPFDLYIPGIGRGTIRIGNRGAVIQTPIPNFISFKHRPQTVNEFAELIERKFGKSCTLIGKAVSLLGMLAREFVFVFHEGASSYTPRSRKFLQALAAAGLIPDSINPILRIRYDTWTALSVGCAWMELPRPLQRPFATAELCSPSFASRWRAVSAEQSALLEELKSKRNPLDLIEFFAQRYGDSWNRLAAEYRSLAQSLKELKDEIDAVRRQRSELYRRRAKFKALRLEIEKNMGDHFRRHIFEAKPSDKERSVRSEFSLQLARVIEERDRIEMQLKHAFHTQLMLAKSEHSRKAADRRKEIELEAELHRAGIIRDAVITSSGLDLAARRPSAWWFPLVSPDGLWFKETVDTAQYYLEPLL